MITPEDRERLAKSKFSEWFDEIFEERLPNAVKKMTEAAGAGDQQQQQGQQNGNPAPDPGQQQQQQPTRRRSLLETCLSDTFGF